MSLYQIIPTGTSDVQMREIDNVSKIPISLFNFSIIAATFGAVGWIKVGVGECLAEPVHNKCIDV